MPKRIQDLIGQRFGLLTVTSAASRHPKTGQTRWAADCDCGRQTVALTITLRSGGTRSCGCRKRMAGAAHLTTHGLSKTRAHGCWKAAKQRCFDPAASNYKHYGGRGITMAPLWAADFAAFYAELGECPPGFTLDRIDVAKNYEPGNCRWATQGQQVRNTRRNVFVEHQGVRVVMRDFARALGVNDSSVRRRMRAYGETAHEAAAKLLEYQRRHPKTATAASA